MFHFATQHGQIFGFWQTLKDKAPTWAKKPMGDCEMCYSAWLANISWIVFFSFNTSVWWIWILHWICYTSIGTILNVYILVRLFEVKQQNLPRKKVPIGTPTVHTKS